MGAGIIGAAFVASPFVIAPQPADIVGERAQVVVADATAPFPLVQDFGELSVGEVPGVLLVPGAQLAERCVGQMTSELGSGFERTTGAPTAPPTLAVPAPEDGLYAVAGCVVGLAGGLAGDDIGEGSITILYDQPHQVLGLHLSETDAGAGLNRFECFDSSGNFLDAVVVPTGNRDLTFTSLGAPIRVITFNTTDPLGAGIDNLRHRLPQAVLVEGGPAPLAIAADFGGQPDGELAGVLDVAGARIAEACVGQIVVELATGFEASFAQPAFPPTLEVPGPGDGLFFADGQVMGLAEGTATSDIGEGAITIHYATPQKVVGLRTIDAELGPNHLIRFECFAADGSPIGVATALAGPDRELTIRTPAIPFSVLTITTTDGWGLAIDDLRHALP